MTFPQTCGLEGCVTCSEQSPAKINWEKNRPSWDDYFLTIARSVARRADCRRRQHGCVLVDADNRIIATGYNGAPAGEKGCLSGACPRGMASYEEVRTLSSYDAIGPGYCISVHAEANALLYARTSCKGATAYITGEPCPTCHKLLRAAGVERIVW